MQAWATMCIAYALAAPCRLRLGWRVQRDLRRIHRVELAVHPFHAQVLALWLADRVPAEHAFDRGPRALAQRVDQLAVVERLRLRDALLQHLSGRVRFGRGGADRACFT